MDVLSERPWQGQRNRIVDPILSLSNSNMNGS